MNGFYVSLIFLGIILVAFSLLCIFLDKKKVFTFAKNFDEKKQQLVEVMNDAEQMIDELNKFSDYIVNQVDLKNEELNKNIKFAEERVNALSGRARVVCNEITDATIKENEDEYGLSGLEAASVINSGVQTEMNGIPIAEAVNGSVVDRTSASGSNVPYVQSGCDYTAVPLKKREKVVPINNKYSEVLRLSGEGMQSLEIAKRLNLGKGEVELILDLRK